MLRAASPIWPGARTSRRNILRSGTLSPPGQGLTDYEYVAAPRGIALPPGVLVGTRPVLHRRLSAVVSRHRRESRRHPARSAEMLTAYPGAVRLHGALCTAIGRARRRRVILVSLVLYALSVAGCALFTCIEHLGAARCRARRPGAGISSSRARCVTFTTAPRERRRRTSPRCCAGPGDRTGGRRSAAGVVRLALDLRLPASVASAALWRRVLALVARDLAGTTSSALLHPAIRRVGHPYGRLSPRRLFSSRARRCRSTSPGLHQRDVGAGSS